MPWDLKDIIDFENLGRLFDAFYAATGIPVSIVSLDGKSCADVGHQKICSDFYLRHPVSASACLENQAQLQAELMRGEHSVVQVCPYGLFNGATPIHINHIHAANLFTGKFFFEPPDADAMARFKQQAAKLNFDGSAFIEAVLDVPIVPKNRIHATLQYLRQLAEMIGQMGINRLKIEEGKQSIDGIQASLKKEIKQREEEAKKLTQIIEGSPIPTFVIDSDSRITHWNRACEKLTGASATEIIGTDNHQKTFYPNRRPLMADLIVKNAGSHEFKERYGSNYHKSLLIKDGYEGEAFFPQIGKTGKRLFFTAGPIMNAKGKRIGAIETIQDISARREAEQNLRTSEARYRQLFDSANDGIFVLRDGIVVDCNQKALELFNVSREEAIGQSAEKFSPEIQPDGQSSTNGLQKKRDLVNQGVRQSFDWRFFRKDGSPFDAEVSLTRSMINDVPHTLAVVRDITERQKMILALKEREKELEEKSRYLEKVNQALKASLDHREVEKRAVEENMMAHLKRFVFPYLEALGHCGVNTDARAYLNIIETNLNDIVSRFSKTVFWKYQDLTPTEVQIADLIRSGKNTKAIAQMLGLSPSSIQWHRKNIREKLGLTNKKVNLQTYLTSLTA
ncbi:PocR ligand-binding domain-containing protein [Desulfosarcina ovata]|nr:PocR ligand-binding domain-containing protein [Desulfosarcina ovata]